MIQVFTGPNSFLIKQEVKRIIDAFVLEHTDFGLERIDGAEAEFQRMVEAVQSLPFLVAKKLVVLREPGANKQFAEQFEKLLPSIPEETDVVIVEPKIDKRTAYYKALKKHTDFHECPEMDPPKLSQWLQQEAKRQGGALRPNDATFLMDRVGTNQQMLFHELQKLLQYQPDITRQTIELLTERAPQSTVFELIESALAGDHAKTMRLYDEQRKQKVEPQAIIGLLAWQMHVLAVVASAGSRDPGQITSEAKLNPYVVRKSQPLARKLGQQEIYRLLRTLLRLDIDLKSKNIDADEAVRAYLLHM